MERSKPNVVAYPAGDRFDVSVTEQDITERANRDGPLRILFLGNVIERKQLHVLIEALGLTGNANIRVDVVGGLEVEPEYANRVRQQVESDGLGDQSDIPWPSVG